MKVLFMSLHFFKLTFHISLLHTFTLILRTNVKKKTLFYEDLNTTKIVKSLEPEISKKKFLNT